MSAMIPVLAPSSISEQMELGLIGWEMSRYTGLWVGLKVVTEIMDSSESVSHDPGIDVSTPADFEMPTDGLSLRSRHRPRAGRAVAQVQDSGGTCLCASEPARSCRLRNKRGAHRDRYGRQGARRHVAGACGPRHRGTTGSRVRSAPLQGCNALAARA